MRTAIVMGLLAACLCACGAAAPPGASTGSRGVEFTSSDGVPLHGTLYIPAKAASKPPALVLVHMVGSSRGAWEPFAIRAQRAGYLCLAFDARGHGESTGEAARKLSYRSFETKDWLAITNDIGAAHQCLLDNGADPANMAIVGASIGANLALRYGLLHADIPAIVMISPGLDYKGVETPQAIKELGKRPVLLVTSQGDSYSASSCTTLKQAASGLCELREYAGSAHGTNLLDASPNAGDDILLWLKPIIGPGRP